MLLNSARAKNSKTQFRKNCFNLVSNGLTAMKKGQAVFYFIAGGEDILALSVKREQPGSIPDREIETWIP